MNNSLSKNCIVCKKEFKKPYHASLRRWQEQYKTCSNECRHKYWVGKPNSRKKKGTKNSVPAWNKGKIFPQFQGENSSGWKGGVTPIHQKIRTSTAYKDWRRNVLQRDNYTCVECHSDGITLQVDHIKPFAYFPELRLVIDNGRTLCIDCHKNTDTYAGKVFKYLTKAT